MEIDLERTSRHGFSSFLFQWIWCQPQNLLGALFWLLVHRLYPDARMAPFRKGTFAIEIPDARWGLSLGSFLFCGTRHRTPREVKELRLHEWGHSRQSVLLGPLYLLVIGIPSLCWALAKSRGYFPGRDYCWFYTEAWAERWKASQG